MHIIRPSPSGQCLSGIRLTFSVVEPFSHNQPSRPPPALLTMMTPVPAVYPLPSAEHCVPVRFPASSERAIAGRSARCVTEAIAPVQSPLLHSAMERTYVLIKPYTPFTPGTRPGSALDGAETCGRSGD